MLDQLNFKGKFQLKHYRKGKLIGTYDFKNSVVDDGLNLALNVMFGAATAVTAWYCGLISASPTLSTSDTMASHTGWTENTTYSNSARATWTPTTAVVGSGTNRTITNTTAMSFSITGATTISGFFISSSSTKTGTTGTLWSEATVTPVTCISGDTILVTYTLNG